MNNTPYPPPRGHVRLLLIFVGTLIVALRSGLALAYRPRHPRLSRRQGQAAALRAPSEAHFRAIFDALLEGAQIIGFDWRYRYLNPTAERHNRRPNAELLGNDYRVMWPGVESTPVFALLQRCMEQRIVGHLENAFVFPDGSSGWFELSIQPIPEGIFIFSIDITEQKRKDGSIYPVQMDLVSGRDEHGALLYRVATQREITEQKQAAQTLLRPHDQLAAVVDIEHALAGSLDEATTYAILADGIQRLFLDIDSIFISRFDADRELITAMCGFHEGGLIDVAALPVMPLAPPGKGIQSQVIRSRQPRIIAADLKGQLNKAVRVGSEETDTQSALFVPMLAQDTVIGVIQMQSYTPNRFTEEDVRVLTLVANTAAVSIQNARLYQLAQQELAERKQAEESIREHERQLQALVTSLDDIVFELDDQGTCLNVWTADERLLIHPRALLLGRRLWDIPGADMRFVDTEILRRVVATGHSESIDYPLETPVGQRWFTARISPIVTPAKTTHTVSVLIRDITGPKRAEDLICTQRDLARVIGTVTSSRAGFQVCLNIALRVSGMDCGGIYLFDPEERDLELVYHQGLGAEFVSQASRYTRESPNVQMVLSGISIYISFDELSQDALFEREGLRTIAVVPIHFQERVIGCLNLASHSLPDMPEFARQAIETIAAEIGNIVVYLRSEAALRASEEQYRGLMESLDNVIATVDARGTFLYLNDVAARYLGGVPGDFLGKTVLDIFPAAVASRHLGDINRVISDDCAMVAEAQMTIQGEPRWYRSSLQPIHDDTGQVACVLINLTDIHNLKTAQQDLLELNRTLEERVRQRTAEVQDLYDNAPTGYHSLDADGRLVMINQTELSWLGYSRDELIGRSISDFLTPSSRAILATTFPAFKQTGWLRDLELEFVRDDGTTFPGLINATAIYDDTGAYLMSRSTVFDITQRKQVEAALRESEAQNRLLFEAAPDAVVLFDALGQVVRLNHAFELLTGYSRAQIIGLTLDKLGLLPVDQIVYLSGAVVQALQSDSFAATTFTLVNATGESRVVGVRIFGLRIGGVQHYLTAMRDITMEKQAEEALRLANAELARAARAKDEFLANMSHELRTPLNAILGFSESLQEAIYDPLSAPQQTVVRHIETSGRHLLTLINDILDLAKVEAGRLELNPEPVSLYDICEASLMFVKEPAIKKRLALDFHISDQINIMEVDPKRLKQMLVNLLSNAVKFTPERGRVTLDVTIDAEAGGVFFVVTDTGIGIAPEDLRRLFQPFSQLDPVLNREHEGTGLGLALVRRLAELHGGSVTVESEVGKGSCFRIALPYHQVPQKTTGATDPGLPPASHMLAVATGTQRGRILLAEDNEMNIDVLSDYLLAKGYQVVGARDGYEALARAEEVQPDVILMDIQMPGMDGLEVIRRLRARPEGAAIPIIALTALAMPGDRERCLEAGANAYLTKPVSLTRLVKLIEQLFRQ